MFKAPDFGVICYPAEGNTLSAVTQCTDTLEGGKFCAVETPVPRRLPTVNM